VFACPDVTYVGLSWGHNLVHPPFDLLPKGNQMSHELGSAALHDLREQIYRENDPERLRELVLNINVLLNMIEDQVARLEGRQFPRSH
jgi:hypothetical protein